MTVAGETKTPRPKAGRWIVRGWPTLVIALAGVSRLPTLALPLTEAHSFRQTQTAFPALIWRDAPIDLLRPEVPVIGPPWVLPFEFPIVQAVGALLVRAGLPVEVAMRGLALTAFLASAAVLWLLLSRHTNRRTADIALVAFLISPFAIEWSRASLIEYPAVLGALLFVLAVLEGGRRWLLVAVVGGISVVLIKFSTAVFWLAPVVLTRRPIAIAAAGIAAAVGLAWTRYADGVKAANPFSAGLTSSAVGPWMTAGDRLSLDTWSTIAGSVLVSAGMILLPLGLLVILRRERLLWAWFAIALVGPLVTFTNMYLIHEYYTAAITPAIAALIGGGADVLLERIRIARSGLVAAAAIATIVTVPRWSVAYTGADPENVLSTAVTLAEVTGPNDLVAMHHHDWSPAVFFYAKRRGVVVWDGEGTPAGYVDVGAY